MEIRQAKKNIIILWGITIYVKQWKTTKNLFSFMSNLQTYYHLELQFQKVDQHTGGKYDMM